MGAEPEESTDERLRSTVEPATRRAYEHVKERLLDGRFPGGTLLSENEIAQRLGVSRTPVRQAMVQLEAEQLLQLYPRRGALVVPISPSEAEDVLEARLLLEQHCARRAAAAGAWLATELNEVLEEQERALATGEPDFPTLDRKFHGIIVAATGNQLLVRQYHALRDRHRRLTATIVARDPTLVARFIAEHRGIAEALERRDADAAADLTARHLHGAHDVARRPRT